MRGIGERGLALRFVVVFAVVLAAHAQAQTTADTAGASGSAAPESVLTPGIASAPATSSQGLFRTFNACVRRMPVYPAASRAAGEEGRSSIGFEVSADGVLAAPFVRESSGFARLDQAALVHVRRCIERSEHAAPRDMRPGAYALPFEWRLE